MNGLLTILKGDAIEQLRTLPPESVQCCVCSPPYWGLRDYGVAGQIGLEKTPEEYVARLVEVFREVRRVLREDGTLWLNLGDSYANDTKWGGTTCGKHVSALHGAAGGLGRGKRETGLKPKDLVGIPWRVAFALQADGWYLRQWMPWVKRNSMPESTQDRPVTSCEIFFLLTKSQRYLYDYDAVKLPGSMALAKEVEEGYNGKATKDFTANGAQNASDVKSRIIANRRDKQRGHSRRHAGFNARWDKMEKEEQCSGWRSTRNSDWFFESIGGLLLDDKGDPLAFIVNPSAYPGAHFATYPIGLARPCVMAGSRPGDTVLDPFAGSGTTGQVALELGRKAILIELNPKYCDLIRQRCNVTPGLPLA